MVCAVRPTALASVYALLASSAPARPLAAYTIASLASSAFFGAIVVLVLNGVRLETGTSTVNAVIELAGGAAALGFAAGLATGRIRGEFPSEGSASNPRIAKHCGTRRCGLQPQLALPPIFRGCSTCWA